MIIIINIPSKFVSTLLAFTIINTIGNFNKIYVLESGDSVPFWFGNNLLATTPLIDKWLHQLLQLRNSYLLNKVRLVNHIAELSVGMYGNSILYNPKILSDKLQNILINSGNVIPVYTDNMDRLLQELGSPTFRPIVLDYSTMVQIRPFNVVHIKWINQLNLPMPRSMIWVPLVKNNLSIIKNPSHRRNHSVEYFGFDNTNLADNDIIDALRLCEYTINLLKTTTIMTSKL